MPPWRRHRTPRRADFEGDRVSLLVNLYGYPVLMPRQLGYKRAKQTVSLRVEISLEDRLDKTPAGDG